MIGKSIQMRICETTTAISYLKEMERLAKKLDAQRVQKVQATTTTPKPRPRLKQGKLYEKNKNG